MIPCPLCAKAKDRRCAYHRATTPADLQTAFVADLKEKGVDALVRLCIAGQSRLVDLPDDLLDELSEDVDKVAGKFEKVLMKERFTVADLQLLAALSLTLAALYDDGSGDPPPAPAPIDEAP